MSESRVAYLAGFLSNGTPGGSYDKLVWDIHEGLTLLSQSTGWDDYSLYECEVLFTSGETQDPPLKEVNASILCQLPEAVEVPEYMLIYFEYQHGDLPWKSTGVTRDCKDARAYIEKLLENCSFVSVLKVKKEICQLWREDLKALLNG